ncbi:hypothetical protein FGB62_100g15 [Gracilaria domingensis]|nr:hypothetical protein FGB62_100g15 [Gracilaria domingensis]
MKRRRALEERAVSSSFTIITVLFVNGDDKEDNKRGILLRKRETSSTRGGDDATRGLLLDGEVLAENIALDLHVGLALIGGATPRGDGAVAKARNETFLAESDDGTFCGGVQDLHASAQRNDAFDHLVDGVAVHVVQRLGVLERERISLDLEDGLADEARGGGGHLVDARGLMMRLVMATTTTAAAAAVGLLLVRGVAGVAGGGLRVIGSGRVSRARGVGGGVAARRRRRRRGAAVALRGGRVPLRLAGGGVCVVPAAVGRLVRGPAGGERGHDAER